MSTDLERGAYWFRDFPRTLGDNDLQQHLEDVAFDEAARAQQERWEAQDARMAHEAADYFDALNERDQLAEGACSEAERQADRLAGRET